MLRRTIGLVMVALVSVATVTAADDGPLFDPATGYRVRQYRAVTGEDVPGVPRVDIVEVLALRRDRGAALVDVMAADGAVADPITGVWRVREPRRHMAGSVWLPNVGRGELPPDLDAYFRAVLARLTAGQRAHPIVIYCQADCWMGWNAAKRAVSYGYTAVHWYPDGTDGMADWDVPLVPATPEPVPQ